MNTVNVQKHLGLIGLMVKDKVTGLTGVVQSVEFDLYGCIQASVTPKANKDGKIPDARWFDVARLKVLNPKPVMRTPDFEFGPDAEGKRGPAEKMPLYQR
jgi:hypothetical protein